MAYIMHRDIFLTATLTWYVTHLRYCLYYLCYTQACIDFRAFCSLCMKLQSYAKTSPSNHPFRFDDLYLYIIHKQEKKGGGGSNLIDYVETGDRNKQETWNIH